VRGAAVGLFSATGDGLGTILETQADGSQITTSSRPDSAIGNSIVEYDWRTTNPTTVPVQPDVAGVNGPTNPAIALPRPTFKHMLIRTEVQIV
jgi:hypothetical protein